MGIDNFEELKAWQEARTLANTIYKITAIGSFSKDFGLRDQIRRASASTMLNIAEGFDSSSDQQFIQFLSYALRSCSEIQAILYVSLDNNYISYPEFKHLCEKAKVIRKMCSGLIRYLKKTGDRRLVTGD